MMGKCTCCNSKKKKDRVRGRMTEMVENDNHIDDDNHITNNEKGTNQEVRIQTRKRKGKNTGKNIFGGIEFKLLNLRINYQTCQ